VTPRVLELRKRGLLVFSGVRGCRVTGYRAQAWIVSIVSDSEKHGQLVRGDGPPQGDSWCHVAHRRPSASDEDRTLVVDVVERLRGREEVTSSYIYRALREGGLPGRQVPEAARAVIRALMRAGVKVWQ